MPQHRHREEAYGGDTLQKIILYSKASLKMEPNRLQGAELIKQICRKLSQYRKKVEEI